MLKKKIQKNKKYLVDQKIATKKHKKTKKKKLQKKNLQKKEIFENKTVTKLQHFHFQK